MICVGVALVSPMYAFEGGSENVALGILVIAAEVRFRPRHRRLTNVRRRSQVVGGGSARLFVPT
jgi:hypothetical protein